MLTDICDILIGWDNDGAIRLGLPGFEISLNSKVRSIRWRIHTVAETGLIENRINLHLQKVVKLQTAVNTSVFIHNIRSKHLHSVWDVVSHIYR